MESLFLTDASGYYLDLLKSLVSIYAASLPQHIPGTLSSELGWTVQSGNQGHQVPSEQIVNTVYRCLIYLGDLSRYREVHADKKHKAWGLARKFYRLSMAVCGEVGNPFNQLAVIDTYEGMRSRCQPCYSILFISSFNQLAVIDTYKVM
jgi:hypothetical protein